MIKMLEWCILLICITAYGQYKNLKFENYDTQKGLSSSTCLEIFQDNEGFLWFGTIDGLNKFNGYDFETFRPSLNDRNSISNNRITAITQDSKGRLWVGTSNGLNILDKEEQKFYRVNFSIKDKQYREIINTLHYDTITNSLFIGSKNGLICLRLEDTTKKIADSPNFIRYTNQPGTRNSIENNNVTNIISGQSSNLWILTDGHCLNELSIKEKKIRRFEIDNKGKGFLGHLPKQIAMDSDGNLWIGNDISTLYTFDTKKHLAKCFSFMPNSVPVFDLLTDKAGILWVSTDGDGIYLIDKQKKIIQHIKHDKDDPFSLPNNQPSKILEDNNGIFWIGSYNKGIHKLALAKSDFGHYYYRSGSNTGLSTPIAQAVTEDNNGHIWIGTDGGGLNLFDEQNNNFTFFRSLPGNPKTLSSDKIVYMKPGAGSILWIGTWDGGLNKFDTRTHTVKAYKHDPDDPKSIGQNTVWCIETDARNRLWLGTSTAGLNLFDPSGESFYQFKHDPKDSKSLINNFVFSLYLDRKNRLFVGTAQGLCYTKIEGNGIPKKLSFNEVTLNTISDNRINFITEDSSNNIWIATDVGLYKLSPDLKLLATFSTHNGLPNNLIVGIQEDNQHQIWITTKSGLSVLDPTSGTIRNFNIHDGLQGIEFQSKSIYKISDGRIIAGGINGFNIFMPASIKHDHSHLTPYINELRLFNKKVNPGDTVNGRVILNRALSSLSDLELKYNEDYISLGFVALNYQNPERVKYAYRLLGLHDNYIELGNDRMAGYSNLSPGNYAFEVLASEDGNWKKAQKSTLNITVLPPFWKTWWAYCLYIIIISVCVYSALRIYSKKLQAEKQVELDEMKLNFFINISHELRTPLTMITNPVEKIIENVKDSDIKTYAQTIQRSSNKLLLLVNQLLDLKKMEEGKMPLLLKNFEIVQFIKNITLLYEELARSKSIKMTFTSHDNDFFGNWDGDKIEKMVTNLLSNAIKFTEKGGSIIVSLERVHLQKKNTRWPFRNNKNDNTDYIQISISDTGIGLKKEQQKHLFERFFQADSVKTGSGIGLNYVKSLVDLHKGKITVESRYREGSTFVLSIPSKLPVKENSIPVPLIQNTISDIKAAEYETKSSVAKIGNEETANDNAKALVLIVEDNLELRNMLETELMGLFRIKTAANGVKALEKTKKYFPDLIISDITMPKMNGFELTRILKNDPEVGHIPVILLTARAMQEDEINGLVVGADEYLTKPFNMKVLTARITNLLESRKRQREHFASIRGVLSTNEKTKTADEIFLDNVARIVLENIKKEDYSMESILNALDISHTQFYRKINSLSGVSPSVYIRNIRLKHASILMLDGKHSIKSAALTCGFTSPAYFTKTFKELYTITPSEFLENERQALSEKDIQKNRL